MDPISSHRGNRLTQPQTNRQDQLQYTTPQLAHSVIKRLRGFVFTAVGWIRQDEHQAYVRRKVNSTVRQF